MTDDTQKQVVETVAVRDMIRILRLKSNHPESDWAIAANLLEALAARLAEVSEPLEHWIDDAFAQRRRAEAAEARLAEAEARAAIARWNVSEDGGLVRVCRGEHEKGEDCAAHEEVFVPRERAEATEARNTELEALLAAYQDQTVPDLTAVYIAGGMDRRDEVARLKEQNDRLWQANLRLIKERDDARANLAPEPEGN